MRMRKLREVKFKFDTFKEKSSTNRVTKGRQIFLRLPPVGLSDGKPEIFALF
jgi:hypothetical protein